MERRPAAATPLHADARLLPAPAGQVLHYTLGPFKPWHWWMGWVAEQHSLWLEVSPPL